MALDKWNKPSRIWSNFKKIGIYAGLTLCGLMALAFTINLMFSFFCSTKGDGNWNKWSRGRSKWYGSFPIMYTGARTIFSWITGPLSIFGIIMLVRYL